MNLSAVVTRPFWLVTIPATLSFAAWAYPWSDHMRRGFDTAEPLGGVSVVFLLGWYLSIGVMATLGWFAGREIVPSSHLDSADDDRIYRILTMISAVGVLGMYALVAARAPGLLVQAFQSQQFNLVREQVPNAPGLSTLRYASILAGAIALHRLVIMRQGSKMHWLNLALLVLNIAVASRLALIMSLVVFAGLWAVRRAPAGVRGVSKMRLVILALVAVGVLTEANYLRNANYYESFYGTRNAVTMMASEVVTYVGSPTQVAVATTRDTTIRPTISDVTGGVAAMITPSFFTSATEDGGSFSAWYRGRVSIESGLTTNSALALVYGKLGFFGAFLLMNFVALIAGGLMGHCSRYKSYMAIGAFVVGYCFVELWRTYLFSEGIVWFLMIALGFACFAARPRGEKVAGRAVRRVPVR